MKLIIIAVIDRSQQKKPFQNIIYIIIYSPPLHLKHPDVGIKYPVQEILAILDLVISVFFIGVQNFNRRHIRSKLKLELGTSICPAFLKKPRLNIYLSIKDQKSDRQKNKNKFEISTVKKKSGPKSGSKPNG